MNPLEYAPEQWRRGILKQQVTTTHSKHDKPDEWLREISQLKAIFWKNLLAEHNELLFYDFMVTEHNDKLFTLQIEFLVRLQPH